VQAQITSAPRTASSNDPTALAPLILDLRRLVPGNAREEIDVDISFVVRQGQTERAMSLTSESGLEIQAL